MKQQDLGLNLSKRRTRKAVFLDEMNLVVPWSELLALIAPRAPRAKTGRPPFELETMLRIHFVQQWFGLSDLAMEEALFETALYREFVGLSSVERIPDRVSILRFRHLLEEHQLAQRILATVNATLTDKGLMLREGTVVDATLIAQQPKLAPHAPAMVANIAADMGIAAACVNVKGKTNEKLAPSCPGAKLLHGKVFNAYSSKADLSAWVEALSL